MPDPNEIETRKRAMQLAIQAKEATNDLRDLLTIALEMYAWLTVDDDKLISFAMGQIAPQAK